MKLHETDLGLSLAAVALPVGATVVVVGGRVSTAVGLLTLVAALWALWDVGDLEVRG